MPTRDLRHIDRRLIPHRPSDLQQEMVRVVWSLCLFARVSLMSILCARCAFTFPTGPENRRRTVESTTANFYFPRDRRPPENRWRNRLPSLDATVVFPSTTTPDPLITETESDVPIRTSLQYRDRVLVPAVDLEGKPNCSSDRDLTFCEDIDDYPGINFEQETRMSKDQFRELFGSNIIDGRKSYSDDETSEERVCRRTEKLVFPKMAKNQMNQWIYVVNNVDYSQAVVSELCEREDKPCSYLEDHSAFSSRCRQKYSYKKLMALHPTEQRTYMDTFRFPSCCACYINVPLGVQTRRRVIS